MPAKKDGSPDNAKTQALRDEVRSLRRRLSHLSRLGQRVASSLDLPTVLQEVVDAACDLTNAQYGALGVFDNNDQILTFITHGLTEREIKNIGPLPKGTGLLGYLHEVQKPVRLHDIAEHPRSVGFPAHHPPMKMFLGVPIRLGAERLGNLYLTEKNGGLDFSEEDEEMVAHLATQAATAISNARLYETVERERDRLRALVNSSPVGVIMVDATTDTPLVVNRQASRILGLEQDENDNKTSYPGRSVRRRPGGSEYSPEEWPIRRALKRGEEIVAEEMHFELPDGSIIPTLVNATPILGPNGRVAAAIAIIQDISPLEEVERLRNEFLGMVSHELRTPLTAIKGSAAIALGRKVPPTSTEASELFQIINEQSDRLSDLVSNLLDMTRIEAGSLSVNPEVMELKEVIQEANNNFARVGGRHALQVRVGNDIPQIKADRRRTVQVLNNLLSNAAKYSIADSPIVMEAKATEGFVTVSVSDQGRGIAPEQMPSLFKKFSRLDDDVRDRVTGTGLGLAICKGIAEAQGGRIWAESEGRGKGSTFSFTLPAVATHAKPDVSRRGSHIGTVRRPDQRTRVLAVDDDPQILRLLRRSLEEAGFHPFVTVDPSQVIKLVESEEPDLVILDLMLAGTSGLDVLRNLREFTGVPVIFLSASDDTEQITGALKLGADDYITKPFSPAELLARIEAALRRRVMPDVIETRPPFKLADLEITFPERRVRVGGNVIDLTATEYKLLFELATNAGRVLTHDQILGRVWGPEYSGATELVRSFVRNLRRKLGDDAKTPRYILTESRVGYRMPQP